MALHTSAEQFWSISGLWEHDCNPQSIISYGRVLIQAGSIMFKSIQSGDCIICHLFCCPAPFHFIWINLFIDVTGSPPSHCDHCVVLQKYNKSTHTHILYPTINRDSATVTHDCAKQFFTVPLSDIKPYLNCKHP